MAFDDLINTDCQGFHLARLDVDVDLALDAADQGDRTHAAHIFQALLDHLIGNRGQLSQ